MALEHPQERIIWSSWSSIDPMQIYRSLFRAFPTNSTRQCCSHFQGGRKPHWVRAKSRMKWTRHRTVGEEENAVCCLVRAWWRENSCMCCEHEVDCCGEMMFKDRSGSQDTLQLALGSANYCPNNDWLKGGELSGGDDKRESVWQSDKWRNFFSNRRSIFLDFNSYSSWRERRSKQTNKVCLKVNSSKNQAILFIYLFSTSLSQGKVEIGPNKQKNIVRLFKFQA